MWLSFRIDKKDGNKYVAGWEVHESGDFRLHNHVLPLDPAALDTRLSSSSPFWLQSSIAVPGGSLGDLVSG